MLSNKLHLYLLFLLLMVVLAFWSCQDGAKENPVGVENQLDKTTGTFSVTVGSAPQFDPPSPCLDILQVESGQTLTFVVTGSDPDAGDIRMYQWAGDELPAGATSAPFIPVSRNGEPPLLGNPVSSTVSWTPPADSIGTITLVHLRLLDPDFNDAGCKFWIEVLPPSGDGEGCTPGYWKNHLDQWGPSGLSPDLDDFDTTFGVDLFDPDITLGDAIDAKGGGNNKIARHGTAALLSALHPDVNYSFTAAEVIAIVQSGDVDDLVDANELGCPLNN